MSAVDAERNRIAVGARIHVKAGTREYAQTVNPYYGYLTSNDPRVHFGLTHSSGSVAVSIRWPDGSKDDFPRVETNQHIKITKRPGAPATLSRIVQIYERP